MKSLHSCLLSDNIYILLMTVILFYQIYRIYQIYRHIFNYHFQFVKISFISSHVDSQSNLSDIWDMSDVSPFFEKLLSLATIISFIWYLVYQIYQIYRIYHISSFFNKGHSSWLQKYHLYRLLMIVYRFF